MELFIPGRVIPKARPRFDTRSGHAYMPRNYSEWLTMASETVTYTLRKPMLDGPLLLRCALAPDGVEVEVLPCSPVAYKGQRGDLDNMIGSVADALQKGQAIRNDRDIVRLEGWFQ